MKFWQSYQTNRFDIFWVISVFKVGSYGAGFFIAIYFFVLIKGYKRSKLILWTFSTMRDLIKLLKLLFLVRDIKKTRLKAGFKLNF